MLSKTYSPVFAIFIVNIEFVVLLQVLVTNVQCKDEPISTCTKGVVIEYQGHRVHVQRKEGDKTHEVYILIALISIIMLDVLVPRLAHSLLVKKVPVCSTTVLVIFYQAIWLHILEDSMLCSIILKLSYSIYLFMLAVLTFTNIFLIVFHPNTSPLCEI